MTSANLPIYNRVIHLSHLYRLFINQHYIMVVIPTVVILTGMMICVDAVAQDTNFIADSSTSLNTGTSKQFDNQIASPKSQIDLTLMATAYSPTQPIATFIGDWDAPLDSGDHAYAQGRMALDVRPANSAISYGLAWRYDYLMKFSEETAEIYWEYENKKNPTESRTYPLSLEAQHNERIGANIGFTKKITPNWQLTTHANIWQGLHALEGKVVGNLSTRVLPDGEVTNIRDSLDKTNAYIDYYYDEPALGEENLNWNPADPSGYGYSLDLHLAGKLSNNTQLSISGYDIFGRMHWQDMPSTRYTLDYDVNGRPLYTIEGQLSTKDVIQTLPWRIEGSLINQLNNQWQLGIHAQTNDVQSLYQLSAGYQVDHDTFPVTITGLIEPQTQAIGLAVDSKYGGIKLLTDDLDSEKAKRSEISLYGRYMW